MTRSTQPLVRLALVAAIAAAIDLLTKQAALLWLPAWAPAEPQLARLAVLYNDRAAFGLSAGAYTWQINLGLTLAAILLVIPVSRDLAALDRRSPVALGLIVGGALGNFGSLVLSPHGVVDFIAMSFGAEHELVYNLADVAAYAGLAMLVRTGAIIVSRMREAPTGAPRRRVAEAFADVEVPRAVVALADAPLHASASAAGDHVRPMSHPLRDAPGASPDERLMQG